MHYHVLTLFPEMIEQGMGTSIMGRAMEQGLIRLTATNIRDFSTNKHMKVDDYPYGGGAGMVMQAEPVLRSMETGDRIHRIQTTCDLSDTAGKSISAVDGGRFCQRTGSCILVWAL